MMPDDGLGLSDYGPNRSAPHAVEAEEALLGCVLINPDSFMETVHLVRAQDFFHARLVHYSVQTVAANQQQSGRRPHIGKLWRQSARYLLDIDGLCEDRVHAAIDWCQDDEFWRPNILSMSKLREKYVVLQAAARRRPGTSAADPLVPRSGLWD